MAFHHLHARTRDSHPSLDKVLYLSGIISIGMMIPQLWLIYGEKNAGGIEPITWITLAVLDIPWIIYGFVQKERPLVFIYTLWLIVNTLIFIGSVLY
ncbi:MAG: hypothetical protein EXS69_00725 [Candidatus Zambryskibacteria bacterium]|nr:hypothetical protein [Candidatus Zambryskibacteria bacterium]